MASGLHHADPWGGEDAVALVPVVSHDFDELVKGFIADQVGIGFVSPLRLAVGPVRFTNNILFVVAEPDPALAKEVSASDAFPAIFSCFFSYFCADFQLTF